MEKKYHRPSKVMRKKQQFLNESLSKDPNRYQTYNPGLKNIHEIQNYKSFNKKSTQINQTQPVRILNTLNQISRPVYRRISYHQKSITTSKRYDEQDNDNPNKTRMSPYNKVGFKQSKKQIQAYQLGRTSILNRSSGKIKSGDLTKQLSPYQLYKQPKSSLSQHYDPIGSTSLHKRRQSHVQINNESLKIAKQLYKNNNFDKCCEFIKKHLLKNNPSQKIQAYYLLGMSFINLSKHQLGIEALSKVIEIEPLFKKTVYLIMALAYKKLNQYQEAIQILSKGLKLYPDYYDLLIYRGKMYLKEQMYEQSQKDFSSAVQINKSKGFAYLGKGTCEVKMKMLSQAIKTFTDGIQTDLAHVCYQKRGICYYEQEEFSKALEDFQKVSLYQKYPSSAAHYYKGMIYFKQHNFTEALLCFQQALKCDNSQELVTLAVEMMLKIKIEQKDFYEAYHLVNRADHVQIQRQVISQWKLFLEASLFLMKKKYKDALSTYQSLEKKQLYRYNYSSIQKQSQKQRYKFLKPLIHLYKAFGHLSQNNPEKALLEYEYHTEICNSIGISAENLSKTYNTLIVKATKQFPNQITDFIVRAKQLIPTKPEPYLFLAFDLLNKLVKSKLTAQQKSQKVNQIIDCLSTGISHLPQLSNNHISSFFYFRSIMELYRQQFSKAVTDIDKAIQKSQDNIPKYFYLRGLIFACFGNFTQAVQDFSVAINLDQKYAKPYLQRAKCLQIDGNSNQAFIDLQKYITLAPQDPYIHKYAGFLLFQNCAYQDCLSAFSHGSDLLNDQELILTKAKCNFLLGDYEAAIGYFNDFQKISKQPTFQTDVQIIKICSQISKVQRNPDLLNDLLKKLTLIQQTFREQDNKIFKIRDIHQIKGSIYLILSQFDSALQQFNITLEHFRIEKQKEFQKNLVEDPNQFEEEWSEIQIKFNISLCLLCKGEFQAAYQLVSQFSQSTQKGKNWEKYVELIEELLIEKNTKKQIVLDTFEQNIRISKIWPKIQIPSTKIFMSMAFSYPFVEPPEMMPEFDQQLFNEFMMDKVEPKPQAPWINRNFSGLVFTPNVQVYENLQLSMTTKKNDEEDENEHHRPTSEMQQSLSLNNSQFQLHTEDLKKKFKLDSLVEMKLNKIMNK